MMLQQERPDVFVIATGQQYSVREFVQWSAAELGIALLGDPSKAREKLGWVPEITAREMCAEMVAHDLDQSRRHALLKRHGYSLPVSLE